MNTTKIIILVALLSGMCSFGYAQDYLSPPKEHEIVLGTITTITKDLQTPSGREWTNQELYNMLLEKAKTKYPNKLVDIRDMYKEITTVYVSTGNRSTSYNKDVYKLIGNVVNLFGDYLSQATNKSLRNVPEGSRLAIDNITVTSGLDKENLKDQLIDVLLEKGYRVVAKEYLQKLLKEQEDQLKSGLFNPDTTVEGSKFSAVGYFINVKVTDTSIRVQVVNVSTGEYEGNVTTYF